MESPCINVCVIDAQTNLCTGCHRSLSEIAQWSQLTRQDRLRIMARLAERSKILAVPANGPERVQ
jgi:uncharacterized protein